MPRVVAFKCKTPGCEVWFPIGDLPDDTPRAAYVLLRLEQEPKRLQCPDCRQAHDYSPADMEETQRV